MSLSEHFIEPAPAAAETWENPGDLRMLSYVPDDLPAGAPLVVVLHGCGQGAEAMAAGAGWLTLADVHGFAVLCPEQRRGNNFNTCFNWFLPEDSRRGGGEAHSIAQMTLRMLGGLALDPTRVFVAGLSAGGAMTNVLLATYPELYAGGAIIAGLPYAAARSMPEALMAMHRGSVRPPEVLAEAVRNASDHRGPWPKVSVWHGDADTTVAPANAGAIIRQWADAQQISAAPPLHEMLGRRERRTWTNADGEAVLELNIIGGLNHAWALATAGADSCGAPGPYLIDADVSTSAEIVRFWGLHTEQKLVLAAPEIFAPARGPRAGKLPAPAAPEPVLVLEARGSKARSGLPAPHKQGLPQPAAADVPARKRGLAARIGGFLMKLIRGLTGRKK